jgi:hypothetical protein
MRKAVTTENRNLATLPKETNRISIGITSKPKAAWCVVTIEETETRFFELTDIKTQVTEPLRLHKLSHDDATQDLLFQKKCRVLTMAERRLKVFLQDIYPRLHEAERVTKLFKLTFPSFSYLKQYFCSGLCGRSNALGVECFNRVNIMVTLMIGCHDYWHNY